MKTIISQVFVGIDVSKNFLDIHIHPLGRSLRIANNSQAIQKLLKELAGYDVRQVVCESSGGYEYLLLKVFRSNNYQTWLVEPKRIRAFIVSEGMKVKTDKIDARMIALFASQKTSRYKQACLNANEEHLKALVMCKANLARHIVQEQTRLKHPHEVYCRDFILDLISFMKAQVNALENQIQQLIDSKPEWKAKAEIITSIPGVGKVTMSTLLSQMPELGSLSNKQAASLVGVAPCIQQSGASKGSATISGGRFAVRRVLYMTTMAAICHNPLLKAFYKRLCDNGKKAKVAIVATMRKLIVILNSMVKKRVTWQAA